MFKNYALLFAICAALLLVGCGNDKTSTDKQPQETQQEVKKDTSGDTPTTDQKDDNTEITAPKDDADSDGMKLQDDTDNKDMDADTMEQEGNDSMKENMDDTMPEKNESEDNTEPSDEKTSGQPHPVADVLKT